MKITKSQLRQIIKEELKSVLSESNFFANMRAKRKKCKGKPKTGDCAEDRPTDKQWKKITTEETRDTYGSEVSDRNKATFKDSLAEEVYEAEGTDKDRMKCNSPRYIKKGEPGYGKKQKVVKACKDGKEKIIRFGDANMENRSDNSKNKKNFRSRHNCDDKKDKFTAGYWSCKDW